MQRIILSGLITVLSLMISGASPLAAQNPDTVLTQKFTSKNYAYTITLPYKAKFNDLGSTYNPAGKFEFNNFIIPGGSGMISVWYRTEGRMVPKEYKLMPDSTHYYDTDSTGRNGIIHRRVYILTDYSVQVDVMLTPKGEAEFGWLLQAMFSSFVPTEGSNRRLPLWRYGRNPREFENGRYDHGAPSR